MSDYIKIRKSTDTWALRAGGATLGKTSDALELREGDYPPVIYVPRDVIEMAALEPSDTTSVCPHKGVATYYSIRSNSELIKDAAWSYETPKEGVAEIAGHLAFNADKVILEKV